MDASKNREELIAELLEARSLIADLQADREALRANEANLAQAQTITHLGNWTWNLIDDAVSWSDETYRIFGVKKGKFRPTLEGIAALVHPDDISTHQQWLAKCLAQEPQESVELRIVRPSGEIRFLRAFGAEVETDASGQQVRFFGTVLDNTDCRRTEQALRASEEQFRAIFEGSNDAIALHTILEDGSLGPFVEVNHVACRMLGYPREQFLPMTPLDFVVPEFHPQIAGVMKVLEEKGHALFETVMRTKDGANIFVEVSTRVAVHFGPNLIVSHVRDITGRKLTEQALVESEGTCAFLASILENSSQPFAVSFINGRIGIFNNAFLNLTRYSRSELMNVDWVNALTPPEWHQIEQSKLAELTHPDQHVTYEKEFIRKDGSRVPIELLVHAHRDANGDVDYYSDFITDITERKNNEIALRQREEEFRLIFENNIDAIFWVDASSGSLIECNPAAERLVKRSRKDIIGMPQTILHPGGEDGSYAELFKEFIKNGGMPSIVTSVITADGEMRPVEISGTVAEVGGRIIAQGLFRDITERKQAMEELIRSQVFSKQLVDTANVMVVCLDSFGKVIVYNECAEQITGYTREEVLGQSWFDFAAPMNRFPQVYEVFSQMKESDEFPRIFENPILTKSGEERIISWQNSVMRQYAEEPIIVSFGIDITSRIQTENALRVAMEKLEASNKAKSEFLANMSHEIRTPVSAILSLADHAQRLSDPKKIKAHLGQIADSAKALVDIIGDILDLARVEAGKFSLDEKPFPLSKTIHGALEHFRRECLDKGLTLNVEIAEGIPDVLVGDSVRLRQLLTNLVGNAIKFTSQGGITITVAATPVATEDRVELHFAVRDTGIGISPEHIANIFENYWQADSSFSKSYQGVGLGLAICRELTTRMGGRIWAESVLEAGSTFHFTVTLGLTADAENTQDTGSEVFITDLQALRILVAEDNPINRQVFQEFLSELGHSVQTVSDGQEALDIVGRKSFDLILMDIQMPRLDGLEAARRIRQGACGPVAAELPIIALTAYAMSGDRERFLSAGMTDYLGKPIPLDTLQSAVNRFARKPMNDKHVRLADVVNAAYRPLLGDFIAFIKERAEHARSALSTQDYSSAAAAGHDIKGTSMAIGIEAINAAGSALESACRGRDLSEAMLAVGHILKILGNLEKELADEVALEATVAGNATDPSQRIA